MATKLQYGMATTKQFVARIKNILLAAAASEDEARELLKKFQVGLKKHGVDIKNVDALKVLGTGTRGSAFDLGETVLKVTNDEAEAKVAAALVNKDVKGVVQFYKVLHLEDTHVYCIEQEKLLPLSRADAESFNQALIATAAPIWIKRAEGSWDNVRQLTLEHITKQVKKNFENDFNSKEAKEYVKNVNEKWNLLVKTFGLRDLFNTLTELGIEFHDYHAGNMMRRKDGSIVLIDLGMSKTKSGGKIITIKHAKLKGNGIKHGKF